MIKSIIWVLLIYSTSIHPQTSGNEWSCQVYSTSLIGQKLSETRPVMVTFDFEISSSLKQDLLNSNLLNKKEKNALRNVAEQKKSRLCEKIKNILVEKQTINVPGDYEEYDKIGYANPYKASCNKAFLIYERIVIKKNHPPNGGIVLETYKKSNALWELVERKILEMY